MGDDREAATLRPATDADRPFLAWLEEVCMRDYAVALWGEWQPEPEDTFSIEAHRVVVVGGQDAGWITAVRFPDHIGSTNCTWLPHSRTGGTAQWRWASSWRRQPTSGP